MIVILAARHPFLGAQLIYWEGFTLYYEVCLNEQDSRYLSSLVMERSTRNVGRYPLARVANEIIGSYPGVFNGDLVFHIRRQAV